MGASEWLAMVAVTVSIFSIIFAVFQWRKANRSEEIKALQGEKEAVAYVAHKIAFKGLPRGRIYREQLLESLCLAAVFERSDRSRALIYSALRRYLNENDHKRVTHYLNRMNETFTDFESVLDLKGGYKRLNQAYIALKLKPPYTSPP